MPLILFDYHSDTRWEMGVNNSNWVLYAQQEGLIGDVYWVRPEWAGKMTEEKRKELAESLGFAAVVNNINDLPKITGPALASIDFDYFSYTGEDQKPKRLEHRPSEAEIRNTARNIADYLYRNIELRVVDLTETGDWLVFSEDIELIREALTVEFSRGNRQEILISQVETRSPSGGAKKSSALGCGRRGKGPQAPMRAFDLRSLSLGDDGFDEFTRPSLSLGGFLGREGLWASRTLYDSGTPNKDDAAPQPKFDLTIPPRSLFPSLAALRQQNINIEGGIRVKVESWEEDAIALTFLSTRGNKALANLNISASNSLRVTTLTKKSSEISSVKKLFNKNKITISQKPDGYFFITTFRNLDWMAEIYPELGASLRYLRLGPVWYREYIEPYLIGCGFNVVAALGIGTCSGLRSAHNFWENQGFGEMIGLDLSSGDTITYIRFKQLRSTDVAEKRTRRARKKGK